MSSIVRIENLMESFTPSEKKLANYIIDNLDTISNLSTSELATYAGTSPASVIRFSRKLGYEGFGELKISIAKDVALHNLNEEKVYEAVTINDSIKEIINKIARQNINAIEDTIKLIEEESISNAIEAMKNAKHIYLFGAGASGLVAKDLQYKLVRINIPVSMYMDSHTQLASAANIKENEVAIGISHSGKTLETYKALEMAKKAEAKTISITKYGNNPISDICDINIFTTGVEKGLRAGAIASRIAQLTIIDILYIGIAKQNFNTISKNLKQSSRIVEDFKIKNK